MASTGDENATLPIHKRPKDDKEDSDPKTDPTDKAKVDEESVPEAADDAKQDGVKEEMNDAVSKDLDTDEKKEELEEVQIKTEMMIAQNKEQIELKEEIMVEKVIDPIDPFDLKNIAPEIKNLAEKAKSYLDSTPPTVIKDFHVVIYIHGFDNNEKDMKRRSKLLDDALGPKQLISTSLNWNSNEYSVWEKLSGYKKDQKESTRVAQYLCQYLQTIRNAEIFNDKQIHIIAHSMGNHLLCQGINGANGEQLDVFNGVNIVCFAADESVEEHEKAIENVCERVLSWTHWWYSVDKALLASQVKNHDRRAGRHDISKDMNKKGDIKKGADLVKSYEWSTSLKEAISGLDHSYIECISPTDKNFDETMREQVRSVLGLNQE